MTNTSVHSTTETRSRTRGSSSPPGGWVQRISCITTTRADSGIYSPLLTALSEGGFNVSCLAGGTHLHEAYGRTISQLAAHRGVRIIAVNHFVSGDEPRQVADTAGKAIIGFSTALAAERPDLVFVLGDRTEMLAAAMAALIHKTPIAHLHGGDITEGAYDDQWRHAITKLAHVHFPALPAHADRIAVMGEESWRIHAVGALAIDELKSFNPAPRETLPGLIGQNPAKPFAVVAFHPETLSELPPAQQVADLASAILPLDMNLLIIDPNADAGREAIADAWRRLATSRPGVALTTGLTQSQYWSCLAHAALLIGNSSAGIIEAASLKVPVVNIGDRQAGRTRAANVIDCPTRKADIVAAVLRALHPEFKISLATLTNPYGDGRTAQKIIEVIRNLPERQALLRKKWPSS